jgi:hypothetical protein
VHKSEHNVTITAFLRHNSPWNLSEQHTRRHIFWQNISFKTSVRLVSDFVYQTSNGWDHGNCNSGEILIYELPWWHFVLFSFYVFCKSGVFLLKKKLILKTENNMFFCNFFSLIFSFFFEAKYQKFATKINQCMWISIIHYWVVFCQYHSKI